MVAGARNHLDLQLKQLLQNLNKSTAFDSVGESAFEGFSKTYVKVRHSNPIAFSSLLSEVSNRQSSLH